MHVRHYNTLPHKKARNNDDDDEHEDGAPSRSKKRQKTSIGLLGLPLELLQLITWHMDTATFFTSLLTCKKFMHAAECRRVVLRHLLRLPGIRLGLEDVPTPQLLSIFRRRAARGLCGAGVLADVKMYAPVRTSVSLSKAVFSSGNPAHLATAQDDQTVLVYDLNSTSVRRKAELRSCLHTPTEQFVQYEVVKMAFSADRDIAVLYKPRVPVKMPTISPFVNESKTARQILKLVTFHHLHAQAKGHFYSTNEQECSDIVCNIDCEPVGLAIAGNGNACIAFRPRGEKGTMGGGTELWLICRNSKHMSAFPYDPAPKIVSTLSAGILFFDMQFYRKGKSLNLYRPGLPIHSYWTNSTDPDNFDSRPATENFVLIDVEGEGVLHRILVGMPFFGFHTAGLPSSDGFGDPSCQLSYLAIGINADLGAFIMLMSRDQPEQQCSHTVDLERGRRSTFWSPIALLAGWQKNSSSSLGTVMAISHRGRRIAAATWSRVLIWNLEPMSLIEGNLEQYFPARDWNPRKAIGRLRPTLLSNEGVVYKMMWVGEDYLYATTDRGLVQWDMSALSEGEKEEMALAHDAWPETAVDQPAVN